MLLSLNDVKYFLEKALSNGFDDDLLLLDVFKQALVKPPVVVDPSKLTLLSPAEDSLYHQFVARPDTKLSSLFLQIPMSETRKAQQEYCGQGGLNPGDFEPNPHGKYRLTWLSHHLSERSLTYTPEYEAKLKNARFIVKFDGKTAVVEDRKTNSKKHLFTNPFSSLLNEPYTAYLSEDDFVSPHGFHPALGNVIKIESKTATYGWNCAAFSPNQSLQDAVDLFEEKDLITTMLLATKYLSDFCGYVESEGIKIYSHDYMCNLRYLNEVISSVPTMSERLSAVSAVKGYLITSLRFVVNGGAMINLKNALNNGGTWLKSFVWLNDDLVNSLSKHGNPFSSFDKVYKNKDKGTGIVLKFMTKALQDANILSMTAVLRKDELMLAKTIEEGDVVYVFNNDGQDRWIIDRIVVPHGVSGDTGAFVQSVMQGENVVGVEHAEVEIVEYNNRLYVLVQSYNVRWW